MDQAVTERELFRTAVLKKLTLVAQTSIAPQLFEDLRLSDEFHEMLAHNLFLQVRAHVYGEKVGELATTVELPAPEGRWAMFLWSICPNRWRPWLRRKLGVRTWSRRVGFEQYRTFPQFAGPVGRPGQVMIPIFDGPNWRAVTGP